MNEQKPNRKRQYPTSYHEMMEEIAAFYVESRNRLDSPLSASNPDTEQARAVKPNLLVEWVVDTEAAIAHACRGNEHWEAAALAILREAAGYGHADLSDGLRHDVIQACGAEIDRRGCSPRKYFHSLKKRREEMQRGDE